MKALVLAGGNGTRLRPLSYSVPKQLVLVRNTPVLEHCLQNIAQAGVQETGIIVGDRGDQIEAAIGSGERFGLRITYIPQSAPRGLADCVRIAHGFLGDDDFLMYLGDNVITGGIADLAGDFRRDRPAAQLVVTKVADPREYGVAELDRDGNVIGLQEKPPEPRSDLAITGLYFFSPAIHQAVRSITPSARGELEITDAVAWLLHSGHDVRASVFGREWKDVGQIDDLLDCNRILLDEIQHSVRGLVDQASQVSGPVEIGPGARIVRSAITGPAVIGAGTVIEDSKLGPYTSVGRDCRLTGVGIDYSIVLDGARLTGLPRLSGSLIGRSVQVRAATTPAQRLIVGDHADLQLAVAGA
jgi:glucose-1-phosphate thymidylyltransferase